MYNTKYIVTSTCIPVKGFSRSVIYDLSKMKYEFVPNALADFLSELNKKPFLVIYQETPDDYKETIQEYLEYCLEKEYVLEIPNEIDKNNFPKLNLEYEYPSIITNIVIKLNSSSNIRFEAIKDVLILTKCYNIQLVFERDFELNQISVLLDTIACIGLRSIELIMPFKESFEYEILTERYRNIAFIFIYLAPEKKEIKEHLLGLQQIFTSVKPFEITHLKSTGFFNVHMSLFTESQKHNTYFNRKLFIDANGQIKNAALTQAIFGNINDIKSSKEVLEIIDSDEFQKYWFVHKDLIDVCKHCEFRSMCVDNKIPVKRNDNEWFMEVECNYNPYINKWENEEGYKTLDECGVISNKNGFKINKKRLAAINKELWGE